MIIFKIYIPENVRNNQTTSKNFFLKVYSSLFSESTPNKTFVISRKASINFFEGCTHDYFQNIHPEKSSKQPNGFKNIFQRCILNSFQSMHL